MARFGSGNWQSGTTALNSLMTGTFRTSGGKVGPGAIGLVGTWPGGSRRVGDGVRGVGRTGGGSAARAILLNSTNIEALIVSTTNFFISLLPSFRLNIVLH